MATALISFLGNRIIANKATYTEVVTGRPDLKDQLDEYLLEKERGDLIV